MNYHENSVCVLVALSKGIVLYYRLPVVLGEIPRRCIVYFLNLQEWKMFQSAFHCVTIVKGLGECSIFLTTKLVLEIIVMASIVHFYTYMLSIKHHHKK